MDTLTIKTPSKLNLSLAVYPPRSDGYHPIASVFQTIDVCDTLTITKTDQPGITITCSESDVPLTSTNTIAKSYAQIHTRLSHGFTVHISKKIPLGSGLGGASSNAAGFLCAVNRYYQLGYSLIELKKLGVAISADSPFFMHQGSAWVTGIGDAIHPIPPGPYGYFLLIFPHHHIATATTYAAYDAQTITRNKPLPPPPYAQLGTNDLQAIVYHHHPRYKTMQSDWQHHVNEPLRLTGSGGCVFVPARTIEHLTEWTAIAHQLWPTYWIQQARALTTAMATCPD